MHADSRSILNSLPNVHVFSDIRHIEIGTTEPLMSESSRPDSEINISVLKCINRQVVIKFRRD
jgi:hypothetical protein